MGTVCLQCGDKGCANAFVYCVKCVNFALHRYCLDVIPETLDEFVHWVCDDCMLEAQVPAARLNLDAGPTQKSDVGPAQESDHVVSPHGKPNRVATKDVNSLYLISKKRENNLSEHQKNDHVGKERSSKSNDDLAKSKPDERHPSTRGRAEKDDFTLDAISPEGKSKVRRQPIPTVPVEAKNRTRSVLNDASKINLRKTRRVVQQTMAKNKNRLPKNEWACKNKNQERVKACAIFGKDKIALRNKAGAAMASGGDDSRLKAKGDVGPTRGETRHLSLQSSREKNEMGSRRIGKRRRVSLANLWTRTKKKAKTVIRSEKILEGQQGESSLVVNENGNSMNADENNSCGYSPKDSPVSSAEPVAMPIWRGSFDIRNEKRDILSGVLGHVSILACQKAYDEALQFETVIHVDLLSKSDVWPKSFMTSAPRGDNIALYFFPSKESERDFDGLVDEMIRKELAMKAVVQNAELLIFNSRELPLLYSRFQEKYYLWGVFRQKQSASSNYHPCPEELSEKYPMDPAPSTD